MKHLLIAPPLLFFFAISVIPLLFTLGLSVTNTSIGGSGSFIGLNNYAQLFSDQFFLRGFLNTILYVVLGVTAQYWLGLGLALLVNSMVHGKRLIRLLILLPMMIPPLIVGFVWQTLLDSRYGPVAGLFTGLHLKPVPWLTDPTLGFVSIVIVDTWQWTPFMFLLLFTGLRTLPKEPFEAARVDGASSWRIFWDHTFPMLLPASIAAILLRSIESFKLFDIVFFITGGGPGGATNTLTLLGYFTSLRSGNLGYGAAMSIILLLTVVVLATLILIVVRRLMARADKAGQQALDQFLAEPLPVKVA
ncbi:MAG: sugar ABC transporter permease [Chloroflexi bacterium]|mgnify:CR=1 FL=1|nr:sugar ABC transporter permease [Chloroflexota bacterium]OJV88206.1 MAG: hypothetical protein BGO39_08420 [Chloroflexi bacterium 54-19]